MGIEKERDLRSELVDGHASSADDLVAVGDAVSQRVRHLLGSSGTGITEVGTGD